MTQVQLRQVGDLLRMAGETIRVLADTSGLSTQDAARIGVLSSDIERIADELRAMVAATNGHA